MDTLDLYQARQRAAFVHQASVELGQGEERIKRDLGQVLLKLEAMQAETIRRALEVAEPEATEDEELRKQALEFVDLHAKLSQLVAELNIKLSHLNLSLSDAVKGGIWEGALHGNGYEGSAMGSG